MISVIFSQQGTQWYVLWELNGNSNGADPTGPFDSFAEAATTAVQYHEQVVADLMAGVS